MRDCFHPDQNLRYRTPIVWAGDAFASASRVADEGLDSFATEITFWADVSDWFVSRRDKDLLAASETASKLATPNFSTEVELLVGTAGPRRTYLRRQADSFDKSSIFGFIAQVFESGIHWEIQQIVLTLMVGCLQVLKGLYLSAKPGTRHG